MLNAEKQLFPKELETLEVVAADPRPDPDIFGTLSGLVRTRGRPQARARGLTREVQDAIEATALQCRPVGGRSNRREPEAAARRRGQTDIALIRTMRDGLLRRSEALALTWDDFDVCDDGSGRLRIVNSKTNQGQVNYLGVRCVEALLVIRPEAPAPGTSMFGLSVSQISRRISAAAIHAGQGDGFSGSSPRVGMCQDLCRMNVEIHALMVAGRWKTPTMPAWHSMNLAVGRSAVAQFYAQFGTTS